MPPPPPPFSLAIDACFVSWMLIEFIYYRSVAALYEVYGDYFGFAGQMLRSGLVFVPIAFFQWRRIEAYLPPKLVQAVRRWSLPWWILAGAQCVCFLLIFVAYILSPRTKEAMLTLEFRAFCVQWLIRIIDVGVLAYYHRYA